MKKKIEWVDNKTLLAVLLEMKDLLENKLQPEQPLDVQGIADFLLMKKSTLYKKIKDGNIPVLEVDGKIYSYPSLLNRWIKGHNIYNFNLDNE